MLVMEQLLSNRKGRGSHQILTCNGLYTAGGNGMSYLRAYTRYKVDYDLENQESLYTSQVRATNYNFNCAFTEVLWGW
jgi:hypothetical protein